MDIVLLAAFGAMLGWGVGDLLIERSSRKVGDVEALAWIGLVGSVAMLPLVWNDLLLLGLWRNVALLVILGVVTYVTSMADFEALRIGKLSVVDMVVSLELPFTILLSFFLFGDTLTIWQVVLILLLMWGVAFIAIAPKRITFTLERGAFLALLAALLLALVNVLTAAGSRQASPLLAIWVPWVIFTAICLVMLAKRDGLKTFVKHARPNAGLLAWMAILDTGAWICYALATRTGEVSIVTAVVESYTAIAFVLGVWFNRERITHIQAVGAGVAIVASVLLALTL